MSEPERSDTVICPGCGYEAERFTDYSRAGFPDGYHCNYCGEDVNPTIATLWDDGDHPAGQKGLSYE